MKRRKLIALLMAGTLLVGGTIPAQAAEGNATGSQTVTGSGEVDYVNTTIYNVLLPTTNTLTLIVDPQGLQGVEKGGSASADDLGDYVGKVTCGSIAPIANLGSVPAKVSVALTLTGDATPVQTKNAVEADTGNNILLYAVPAAADFYDPEENGAGYAGSTTGIVMGAAPVSVDFVLPEAEYEFKKDTDGNVEYDLVAGKDPHGTGLKFEGLVNTKADWTEFAKPSDPSDPSEIGMTAAFTFTHNLTDADKADDTEGAPAYMVKDDDLVTVEVEGETQPTDDYVMAKGNDGSVSYEFVDVPTGSLTAVVINGTNKPGMITYNTATYSNGVFTIAKSAVESNLANSGTYEVVVTIGGVQKTLTYVVS